MATARNMRFYELWRYQMENFGKTYTIQSRRAHVLNFRAWQPRINHLENRNLAIPHYFMSIQSNSPKPAGSRALGDRPDNLPPCPVNLPNREKVEKYFFRTMALIFDIGTWAYAHVRVLYWRHIESNPKVQTYWRVFHDKMEKARKK